MGMEMAIVLDNGIPVEKAYVRIGKLEENNKSLTIYVDTYYDHQSFLDGKNLLSRIPYNFSANVSDDAKNYRKQGYEFMKTLGEYADAIDVFEEGQLA
ncbi:hypothetical protein [Heyndrickxia faecalis]|uniref:hypothetical protein n=1 Tax=Heyndrickxia faecalis TaxID=2824910 RepID=UPI001B39F0D2|nr:hypothetical protein [Heyndrickxia faecalis]MBQ4910584.1 hypothetical protein [Heyndrickxia faecalis]